MKTEAVVVADAHLDGFNEELHQFLAFLAVLSRRSIRTLYILGDLFTIWLGTPKLQFAYQRPVIEALQTLKTQGMVIKYVEGNRDYFLSPHYVDAPFSEVASESTYEVIGTRSFYFSHGDLVNVQDKQYRLWRTFSRNRIFYAGFNSLPRVVAVRLANYLERTFRGTNQKHKATFPAELCSAYASNIFQTGYDVIVLGHFHETHQQEFLIEHRRKYLYVLPAWKDTPTYLQISEQGEVEFQQFS
jgi:UDP-2,3-diacylglucosamine hydrolase